MLRRRSPFSLHECGASRGLGGHSGLDGPDRTRQADMDGQKGSSSMCSEGEETQDVPERVTLKKEIGLLSACTIIIGESGNGTGPAPPVSMHHSLTCGPGADQTESCCLRG